MLRLLQWFALCGLVSSASADVISFASLAAGAATPVSVSNGTLTATFSSPDGPVFSVFPSFFSTLTGNVLIDNDAAQHELDIVFDKDINSISLLFGLNGSDSSSITLRAMFGGLGGLAVGSVSGNGEVGSGGLFPEGALSFNAATFNAVRVTSTATDFAIANVDVAAVPEPASFTLFAIAFTVIACRHSRSRRVK